MAEAVDSAIWTRLQAVAGVTNLISTRLYTATKKDNDIPSFPYVLFHAVSAEEFHTFSLPTNFENLVLYRFNIFTKTNATTPGQAQGMEIAKQLRLALHGFLNATITYAEAQRPIPIEEPEPDIHHVVQDFMIGHLADTT